MTIGNKRPFSSTDAASASPKPIKDGSSIVMTITSQKVVPIRIGAGYGSSIGQFIDGLIGGALGEKQRVSTVTLNINDTDWAMLVDGYEKELEVNAKSDD